MAEIKPDMEDSASYDAQQVSEEITSGEHEAPQVDVSEDYERSKEYSVSGVDQGGAGAQAAEAATKPDFNVNAPGETEHESKATGNPDDYRDLAKDVNPRVES